MKIGAAPTAFHARTGEFTAPGIVTLARLKSSSEIFREVIAIPEHSGPIETNICDRKKNFARAHHFETKMSSDEKS
jgi:hypothetical protein